MIEQFEDAWDFKGRAVFVSVSLFVVGLLGLFFVGCACGLVWCFERIVNAAAGKGS